MNLLKVVHLILFGHLNEEVYVFYETSKLQFSKLLFCCVSTFRKHQEFQQLLEFFLFGLTWALDYIFVPVETVFPLNFADILHFLFEISVFLLLLIYLRRWQ